MLNPDGCGEKGKSCLIHTDVGEKGKSCLIQTNVGEKVNHA